MFKNYDKITLCSHRLAEAQELWGKTILSEEGMKETEVKKFRYNDENERYKSLNKFYFIGMNALYFMFLLYLFMRSSFGDLHKVFAYSNMAIVAVLEVINLVTYLKNKASRKYSVLSVICGGLELFLLGANTDAAFIMYAVVIMLMLQIPQLAQPSRRSPIVPAAICGQRIPYRYILTSDMREMSELSTITTFR